MSVNRLLMAAGALVLGISGFSFANGQQRQVRPLLAPNQRPANPFAGGSVVPGSSQGWGRCSQTAQSLAAQTDQALGWGKGWAAMTLVNYKDKDIVGRSSCKTEIESPTRFHIEYPISYAEKSPTSGLHSAFSKVNVIADGSKMAYLSTAAGLSEPQSVGTAKLPSSCPLAQWPRTYPALVFSPIRGGKPFSNLVTAARNGGSNIKITVEERRFDYKGQILHQKRLTVQTKNSAAAPLLIQIVIDASLELPVTITAMGGTPKKDQVQSSWSSTWVKPRSGKFPAADFVVPVASRKHR
jgi:hypothetical protein